MKWFEVDKEGLAKILERRPKWWILAELLQNAWDAPGASTVILRLDPIEGRALADLVVTDDSPAGFADLSHAFTLFSESGKKADPTLRGRFNFGEKLVLAVCEAATIATTKGTVEFTRTGRRTMRRRRKVGTEFRATVRMTRQEIKEAVAAARGFIGPDQVITEINGAVLPRREPLCSFEHALQTDVADAKGMLRRRKRVTTLRMYEPLPGLPARLYEMGIPVMEMLDGDRWDIDVGQKVPVALERDSVPPAYLRDVRTAVLNRMADQLTPEDAASAWVNQALASPTCAPDAVREVTRKRWGKAVAYDPSDIEANHAAAARGYTVVSGGTYSKEQWAQIRTSGALLPAGRVTPTPRPFDPDGPPTKLVSRTPGMMAFESLAKTLANRLLGRTISVAFLADFNATAAYGRNDGQLSFNVGRLGKGWFDGPLSEAHLDLLLHELAHEFEGNHMAGKYHDALTRLGAKLAMLALSEPHLLKLDATSG